MILDEIEALWEQRPFIPFEIKTSDGEVHRVTHYKWILIHPNGTSIHYVNPQLRSRYVAVNQITSVAPVETRRGRSAGGKTRRKP